MERQRWTQRLKYVGLLTTAFLVALVGSYAFGTPLDNAAYDFMFRLYRPPAWPLQSALLTIDEPTLNAIPGGMSAIRRPLAQALHYIAAAKPEAVAIDVILAEPRIDPTVDRELASALCATPNVVLSSELVSGGRQWEDPRPEFKACAAAVGHVHAWPDENDSRTRRIPLLKRLGRDRRWAISLEAFRLSRGEPIVEEDRDLLVGRTVIPVPDSGRFGRTRPDHDEPRRMYVRFIADSMPQVPRVSMNALLRDPALASAFTGKVVFIGSTAQTATRDHLFTPVSRNVPTTGIEINAEAFETIAHGLFITEVPSGVVFLFSVLLAVAMGLAFSYLPGWRAYAAAVVLLVIAQVTPYVFFTNHLVFSFATPASVTWLVFFAAAAHYHLIVRRNWLAEQSARTRYQQAMHFVTHEMRTPLSTIHTSSELISRFALTDDKRKQMAQLITSESKRLARMIEVFLSVEKLSAGQIELKRESIPVKELVEVCVRRVDVLAGRKHITVTLESVSDELQLTGDRELMEYACYNLLTNAVKYSPQRTEVTVRAWRDAGHVRISIKDQGIGMDAKEVKQIFQKFYRTKKAEQTGEAGTGIGLSIVQQIVEQHGGRIEVTSRPDAGSCFTLVLPAAAADKPVQVTA